MITGEHHSGGPRAQSAAAVATMPDARGAVIPDAAYLAPLEQPDAVVELIRDFWARTLAETSKVQR